VAYGDLSASLGNELTPTQVKDIPIVQWKADSGSYYLLVMRVLFHYQYKHVLVFGVLMSHSLGGGCLPSPCLYPEADLSMIFMAGLDGLYPALCGPHMTAVMRHSSG
jgi:hypothetical protein